MGKNAIKAEMDIIKLCLQAIILSYFGLAIALIEERLYFTKMVQLASIILIVFFILFAVLYVFYYGKKLDKEEAKELDRLKIER